MNTWKKRKLMPERVNTPELVRDPQKLKMGMSKITKKIRPERMALELGVSYGTIQSWMLGRRYPRLPALHAIEKLYKVKMI